jgi:uncharacterized protein (DUF488 family)
MTETIFTIGYEKAELDDFILTLKACNIEQVLDVRELPQSRRRGFSKNILATALETEGISYLHFKQLGDPKHGRDAARMGNYQQFEQIFQAHMDLEASKDALASLAKCAEEKISVLLCYERDHRYCHRKILADKLHVQYSFSVVHRGVSHGLAGSGHEREQAGRPLRA